jgi:ribosomal protein S6E (S10)
MQDADWIANQVARGLSESHAVSLLNKFSANQWFSWKSKGKRAGKIANILTRTIAGRMSNLVSEIELAATGGNDACGRPVRHDHRAAAMLAGLHDDRFRNNPQGNTTTNNMLAIGGDASQVNKLIAMFAGQVRGQVDDKPAAPALPAPTDKPIDV